MTDQPISAQVANYVAQEASTTNVDGLLNEVSDLQLQITTLQTQLEAKRSQLLAAIEFRGEDEYANDIFKVKRVARASKVSLKIPVDLLPESFRQVKQNDSAIRKAAAAGQDISDFAEIGEPSYYVRLTEK